MAETVNTDSIRTNKDEALELMMHHLNMAQVFFEIIDDDDPDVVDEVLRICYEKGIHKVPVLEFLSAISKVYKDMEKLD